MNLDTRYKTRSYLVASLDIAVLVLSLSLVEFTLAVVVSHAVLVLVRLRGKLLLFVGGRGLTIRPRRRRRGSSFIGLCRGVDRGAVWPGGGGHKPEQEKILKRRNEKTDPGKLELVSILP